MEHELTNLEILIQESGETTGSEIDAAVRAAGVARYAAILSDEIGDTI